MADSHPIDSSDNHDMDTDNHEDISEFDDFPDDDGNFDDFNNESDNLHKSAPSSPKEHNMEEGTTTVCDIKLADERTTLTFAKFEEFPEELQMNIWKYVALHVRRTIIMKFERDSFMFANCPPTPPLMHVCRQARKYGLEIFQPVNALGIPRDIRNNRTCPDFYFYVNPISDDFILRFGDETYCPQPAYSPIESSTSYHELDLKAAEMGLQVEYEALVHRRQIHLIRQFAPAPLQIQTFFAAPIAAQAFAPQFQPPQIQNFPYALPVAAQAPAPQIQHPPPPQIQNPPPAAPVAAQAFPPQFQTFVPITAQVFAPQFQPPPQFQFQNLPFAAPTALNHAAPYALQPHLNAAQAIVAPQQVAQAPLPLPPPPPGEPVFPAANMLPQFFTNIRSVGINLDLPFSWGFDFSQMDPDSLRNWAQDVIKTKFDDVFTEVLNRFPKLEYAFAVVRAHGRSNQDFNERFELEPDKQNWRRVGMAKGEGVIMGKDEFKQLEYEGRRWFMERIDGGGGLNRVDFELYVQRNIHWEI
ncbi:hypothetical protein EAF04_005477 [Stromatinia cepivora]|nr:hypothetical protein EAF04_005477 [Stromatinia cepivora]